MSNLKRNTLALAVAAGMFLPLSAMAFNATTEGDTAGEPIAQQVGPDVTMTETIELFADGITDNLIGRTTGFGVRLIVSSGTVTGATLADGTGGAGNNIDLQPDSNMNAADDWVAGAPTMSGGTIVWNVAPVGASATIAAGNFLNIEALSLTGAATTGNIVGTIELFDPNTNQTIAQTNVTLITRVDGLVFSCAPQANHDVIDVAGDGSAIAAKTQFVPFSAPIGDGPFDTTAALGKITVTAAAGFTLDTTAGGDTLTSKITGTDLSAFADIFLATDDTCVTSAGSYTINTTNTMATLDVEFDTLNTNAGVALFTSTGGMATLCVTVDGETEATAQQFTVQNGINGVLEADACPVAPIAFNGSVVQVYTFNPAGNTTQESFLRVSNWGSTGGKVTIVGYDDAGTKAPQAVTFDLDPKASQQLNSGDLENGNAAKGLTGAFGDGEGKWRLVVTGEFDGMIVSSLNRNNNSGTLTNITDADNRGEQLNDGKQ